MLKILNILPRIPTPTVDGGAIAVFYNLLNIKREGVEVVVAAFESNRHPQDREQMEQEFTLYSVPANFREYDSKSAFLNLFDARPYNLALRFDQDTFRDLLKRVRQDHPTFDVIQFDWVYMAPYVPLVKSLWPDAKLILRQHNAEYMIFWRMAEHEPAWHNRLFLKLQTAKMKRYESRALTWFDHVITLTDVDKQLFEGLLRRGAEARNPATGDHPAITTIPAGVDIQRFARPVGLPRKKQFLILGSMSWAPYVQALLWFLNHVWQDVHEAIPEYTLNIVGSNPPPEVHAFHGHFNVNVLGFVDDIMPELHESCAMIVPLKSGSGMRIKIIEAMGAELPVITTSVGCEGIPIEHERDCVIGDTVEALHDAIVSFTQLPDQGQSLAANAHHIATEYFSWQNIARKTVELYQ